ncbi:MAG: PrsW family intramembrane metalloprotease [Bacillota bacterium]
MSLKLVLVLFVSIIPGVLWMQYFYKKDRYEPEPKYLVILAFLGGIVSIFPAMLFEQVFLIRFFSGEVRGLFNLIAAAASIGIIEEGLKLLALYWIALRHRDFNEPVDGIIYGVSVGLGFAVIENIFYTSRFGLSVGVLRAVVGCLAHAAFSGLAGHYWAEAKFKRQPGKYYAAFFWPAAWHGLYDFLLFNESITRLFAALAVIGVVIAFILSKIRNLVTASPFKE